MLAKIPRWRTAEYKREQWVKHGKRISAKRRQRYAENANGYRTMVMKCVHRAQLRREEIFAWLKDQPCLDCGGRFPPECMDFDHRPGEVKLFAISGSKRRSLENLQEEMMKCDLICSNCHRIRTRRRGSEKWQRSR